MDVNHPFFQMWNFNNFFNGLYYTICGNSKIIGGFTSAALDSKAILTL
jgi:hypothetical protein